MKNPRICNFPRFWSHVWEVALWDHRQGRVAVRCRCCQKTRVFGRRFAWSCALPWNDHVWLLTKTLYPMEKGSRHVVLTWVSDACMYCGKTISRGASLDETTNWEQQA